PAPLRNGGGRDRYLTGKTPCTRRTSWRLAGAIACDDYGELAKAPIVVASGRGFSARSAALDAREIICMTWAKGSFSASDVAFAPAGSCHASDSIARIRSKSSHRPWHRRGAARIRRTRRACPQDQDGFPRPGHDV